MKVLIFYFVVKKTNPELQYVNSEFSAKKKKKIDWN